MEKIKRNWKKTPSPIRKISVFIVGFLIIITGIILLPLPGPGWAIIFVGLAILATEFAFADNLRRKILTYFELAAKRIKKRLK